MNVLKIMDTGMGFMGFMGFSPKVDIVISVITSVNPGKWGSIGGRVSYEGGCI